MTRVGGNQLPGSGARHGVFTNFQGTRVPVVSTTGTAQRKDGLSRVSYDVPTSFGPILAEVEQFDVNQC